ncbi:ROK family transcriptional regulator [Planotetraspora sp. A-T 1434]|uniref:ROK family transcriptional regulator n=1 Tax=Planotetraspora sp. A-T 1434 TaxID=2979219 RepID=UPI0021C22474|nr:ROK family transcriptional regulator [Planotetraspora sp. A-T 1434]MCT9932887.1 ROK family transcriptional regulator [Planotetraspora sp. A-T 1434]
MPLRPGTPRLLRQINDRAALELLLSKGPLTRAELGELTGLSKVTSGQLLSRLETRGLVTAAGERPGGRGPNAALYGVNPASAYVAGLEVLPDSVTAGVADITGTIVAEITVDPTDAGDPVKMVHGAVLRACESAGVELSQLRCLVIGTRGVVDPATGEVRYSFDLPAWHVGILGGLRALLGKPVIIENDVNLAALAEQAYGAAEDVDDFAILWAGVGQGLGVMLGGRLHRGITGGAGEIGWLPVPGEPLPTDVTAPQSGSFQRLIGGEALAGLAAAHGVSRDDGVAALVRTALATGNWAFIDELAGRLAVGVAAVSVVLDPTLVVLSGDVGRAGGHELAARVEECVARVCPSRPAVACTRVEGNPVLRGAIVAALERAREEVFSDTV